MDIKNIEKIKKEILSGAYLKKVGEFFGANMKAFVFALFFVLSGYCVHIWYSYAYNPQWSDEKKAEYLKTKEKEVTFNRKKFQNIVERERQRAEEYDRALEKANDIFRIK
ncbi:MAG TPA: hypothetical protein DCS28_02515 [Candidatus Moranbacteria bacterium]|nr:hypothetical protein [Candidatus Moranbacteria bacterium]HAT74888.1 hypothetical protein [Candidatus Moranbacteria bacterium]